MDPTDVRDLLAEPGSSRRLTLEETFGDLSTELAAVPEEHPVRMDVLLESVVEGIEVSGPLTGRIAYRCARCLKPFDRDFRLELHELFVTDAAPGDDPYPITGLGSIDLEPMVRDAVVLSMPFSPLCRLDCLGLCSRCGGDRNLGECTCGPERDPRWAPLERLELPDND
jgi:DUF177 domain-containing protein